MNAGYPLIHPKSYNIHRLSFVVVVVAHEVSPHVFHEDRCIGWELFKTEIE